jgi:hypothetical protein
MNNIFKTPELNTQIIFFLSIFILFLFFLFSNNVPLKRCAHTGVTIMSNIVSPVDFRRFLTVLVDSQCCLRRGLFANGIRLTNASMPRRILFILSQHGTKANIRSTKMANNRHAYNRDVLQRYWTSDGLPLFCSQPTGEKTHTNQQRQRFAKMKREHTGY